MVRSGPLPTKREPSRGIKPDLLVALNGLVHPTDPTASSAGSQACGDPSGGGTVLLDWSTSYGSRKQEVAHCHRSLEE